MRKILKPRISCFHVCVHSEDLEAYGMIFSGRKNFPVRFVDVHKEQSIPIDGHMSSHAALSMLRDTEPHNLQLALVVAGAIYFIWASKILFKSQ